MTDTTNDRRTLRTMIEGYQLSQALAVMAHLGIADLLGSDTTSIDELATATSADHDALRRLLRALVTKGILAEVPEEQFRLTPLGEGLRSDVPGSLVASAAQAGQPEMWHAWGHLLHSVMTGEAAFRHAHDMDVWAYRERHPESGASFDAAMQEGAQHVAGAIVEAYPFAGLGTVVDVGGGTGVLLEAILDAHPEVSGVLQDQPQVAARAQERLSGTAIAPRCSLVAGDFFGSVPEGGDLYILKGILHDWDDAHGSQILATCRHAMRAGGRLLVIEQVLANDGNTDPFPRFMDLHMLVIHGARERTEEDYATLLSAAGFRVTRVLPTATGLEIIEATAR
jgi:hypothetical protein